MRDGIKEFSDLYHAVSNHACWSRLLGFFARDRLKTAGRLLGGEAMNSVWGSLGGHEDCVSMLNDVVFCPLVKGTTGWATRTSDVIYA